MFVGHFAVAFPGKRVAPKTRAAWFDRHRVPRGNE